MLFYKVFSQKNNRTLPLYSKLKRDDFIVGNCNMSFGIPYSPHLFNKWINDDNIYKKFRDDFIVQVLLSNEKFVEVASVSEKIGLRMADISIENIDLDDVWRDDELNIEVLEYILEGTSYKLQKISFCSIENEFISIKRNGVLEIEEKVLIKHPQMIRDLLDALNYGPEVIA